MCALSPRNVGSDSTARAECEDPLAPRRIVPLRRRAAAASAASPSTPKSSTTRRAGFGGFGLELVGVMEVRGREPLIDSVGIAMLPVARSRCDDRVERAVGQQAVA